MVVHPSGPSVAEVWASCAGALAVDAATRRCYESRYSCHVGPALGGRAVASVTAQDVTAVLDGVLASGLGAGSARQCKVVLSLLLQHAVELGAAAPGRLPTAGVRLPRQVSSPARVLTPQEYLLLREELPTEGARLLADVLVRSGLRVGEALALAPDDVVPGVLIVRRRLSEPGRQLSPQNRRYELAAATKNGLERRVAVGRELTDALGDWIAGHALVAGGLLFPAALVLPPPSGRVFPSALQRPALTPRRLAELGTFTGPNGRTYQHGTVNGYTTGRCRGACCRQAVSEYSSAKRRERRERAGLGSGPARPAALGAVGQDAAGQDAVVLGVVGRQEWARSWVGAAERAGLGFRPLARQARHAHASWLNGGGVSVEQIAERLGHEAERSTRGYVRPVGQEADPVAVIDALLRGPEGAASPPGRTAAGDL